MTETLTVGAVDTAWGPMLVATSSRGILAAHPAAARGGAHGRRARAARAVGNAMARCPLYPAVPCHRVVRAADGWSGCGSDDRRKRELRERER